MTVENNRTTLDGVINIFEILSKCDPEVYNGPTQNIVNDALYYLIQYRNLTEWFKRI